MQNEHFSYQNYYHGHTFLRLINRCISVKTSLINTKLEDFVNLGVLFLTM